MNSANARMLDSLFDIVARRAGNFAAGLKSLLDAGITQEDGCWFLADLRRGAKAASLAGFPDRTGLECFVNHFHISEAVKGTDLLALQEQGLLSAYGLRNALSKHGLFNIIVAVADAECTVRFHAVRPGESWLSPDLNSYEHEGLLVISTGDA